MVATHWKRRPFYVGFFVMTAARQIPAVYSGIVISACYGFVGALVLLKTLHAFVAGEISHRMPYESTVDEQQT